MRDPPAWPDAPLPRGWRFVGVGMGHRPAGPGVYTVTITVTDGMGVSVTSVQRLTVHPAPGGAP